MLAFFLPATAALAALTLLPLSRHDAWWVRGLDFPRLQLFAISLVLTALEAALLDLSRPSTWGLLSICSACLVYQGWWILPYTRLFPVEVKPAAGSGASIRIMTANVLTPNRNADVLLSLVRENAPDLLVTLESDLWWQERLDALRPDYPFTIQCPLDNLYGMHVYSRLPLLDSRTEYLVSPGVPSMHARVQLADGRIIRVHFLHPEPPVPPESDASGERDAELVIVARSVAEAAGPVIVTGDLNDVAWSETTRLFRKISGLLDPRVGRGMFNTFHADHWFMRWPLDHLFHSAHFRLGAIRRLPAFGSDHFPLMTTLVLSERGRAAQEGLDADAEDVAFALEKARSEGVRKADVPQPGGR